MQNNTNTTVLAASILVGFALVAGAIFFSGGTSTSGIFGHGNNAQEQMTQSPKRTDDSLRHVYGNLDAKTTVVEFSDYECPFCSRLHPTLKKLVDESDGAINWEYRHLPLSIHANAEPSAKAAECVAQLEGNDAFWSYSDALLGNQRGLTADFLQTQAIALGIDAQEYLSCIASNEIAQRVQTDTQHALALGGSGTPFNVVEFEDGTTRSASGALPYANWLQLLGSH